jgi:hypothetical protein
MKYFIYLLLNAIVITVLLLVPFQDLVPKNPTDTVESFSSYLKLRDTIHKLTEIAVILLSFISPMIYFFLGRYDFTIKPKS